MRREFLGEATRLLGLQMYFIVGTHSVHLLRVQGRLNKRNEDGVKSIKTIHHRESTSSESSRYRMAM